MKNKPKPPSTETAREDFEYQLDVGERIVSDVTKLSAVNPTPKKPLHHKHVGRIVELAFMGALASWEDFVEGCLVRYMAGATAQSGYAPSLRLGASDTVDHAYDVLAGQHGFDPSKEYIKWTNAQQVSSLASVFFKNGAPFASVLGREADRLQVGVKLRNRTAHASEKCRADFVKAVNRLRKQPLETKLGQGTTVGSVLSGRAGQFFGNAVPAKSISVFKAYIDLFRTAAQDIAPR